MGILTPYLTYVKIAVVVIALSASAWAGHEWTRRGYEAEKARDVSAAAAKYEASVSEFKAKSLALQASNDAAVVKLQNKLSAVRTDNQKLTKDIANATKNQPACSFTAGFGGVWNDSISRANGVSAGTENPSGASSSDGTATDITRADLLTNHDAVMQQCGKWKAQLDSIIEWDGRIK